MADLTPLQQHFLTVLDMHREEEPIGNDVVAQYLATCLKAWDDAVADHKKTCGAAIPLPGHEIKWKLDLVLAY